MQISKVSLRRRSKVALTKILCYNFWTKFGTWYSGLIGENSDSIWFSSYNALSFASSLWILGYQETQLLGAFLWYQTVVIFFTPTPAQIDYLDNNRRNSTSISITLESSYRNWLVLFMPTTFFSWGVLPANKWSQLSKIPQKKNS